MEALIGRFLEHSKLGWTFLKKEKERERLGDRLITQIERRLLLSLEVEVLAVSSAIHPFINPYTTNSRTVKRQRSVDDDFRRSSNALSLRCFVCLFD